MLLDVESVHSAESQASSSAGPVFVSQAVLQNPEVIPVPRPAASSRSHSFGPYPPANARGARSSSPMMSWYGEADNVQLRRANNDIALAEAAAARHYADAENAGATLTQVENSASEQLQYAHQQVEAANARGVQVAITSMARQNVSETHIAALRARGQEAIDQANSATATVSHVEQQANQVVHSAQVEVQQHRQRTEHIEQTAYNELTQAQRTVATEAAAAQNAQATLASTEGRVNMMFNHV